MMRVITGSARGLKLQTLPGEDITRPTTEAVKEALFSMIQFDLEESRVLDLFAGSGQLGIEALSRGARICTFVENDLQAKRIINENVLHCNFAEQAQIVHSDANSFLSRKNSFDIAFLDPPYNSGLMKRCLELLVPNMSKDGIIVCETLREEKLSDTVGDFSVFRVRSYGKTQLTLYKHGGKD